MLGAELDEVVALVAADIDQEDARRGPAARVGDQAVDGVNFKPRRLALTPAGHVRVEEGLMVLALAEPLELALAHRPLHRRCGVRRRHPVAVLAQVVGELGQRGQGEVIAVGLAGKKERENEGGWERGVSVQAGHAVTADGLDQRLGLFVGAVNLAFDVRAQAQGRHDSHQTDYSIDQLRASVGGADQSHRSTRAALRYGPPTGRPTGHSRRAA